MHAWHMTSVYLYSENATHFESTHLKNLENMD